MAKEKVTVKWSKKEKDWVSKYPEWENRNARITGNAFFDMIRLFEEFMLKDWAGKPTGFTDFRNYLENGGFDPDTFTISVCAKPNPERLCSNCGLPLGKHSVASKLCPDRFKHFQNDN